MTAEQQLERSVLEGKERDELSAIAQAMSLKTTSRTKKADIIDQILHATGVTSGPGAASNGDAEHGDDQRLQAGPPIPARPLRPRPPTSGAEAATAADGAGCRATAAPAQAEAAAPAPRPPPRRPSAGDSGPAVFVEPPELADGADPGAAAERAGSGPEPAGRW